MCYSLILIRCYNILLMRCSFNYYFCIFLYMNIKLWPYCIIYSHANKAILNLNLERERPRHSHTSGKLSFWGLSIGAMVSILYKPYFWPVLSISVHLYSQSISLSLSLFSMGTVWADTALFGQSVLSISPRL